MHIVQRLLSAALLTAGLVFADAPDAQASAIAAHPTNERTDPLPVLLEAATQDLTQQVATRVTAHPVAAGSAGTPSAPAPAGTHSAYCHACRDELGRHASPELPNLLFFRPPARAPLALPYDATLFLAGALAGTCTGLALASMVVGLNGPDTRQARQTPI